MAFLGKMERGGGGKRRRMKAIEQNPSIGFYSVKGMALILSLGEQ